MRILFAPAEYILKCPKCMTVYGYSREELIFWWNPPRLYLKGVFTEPVSCGNCYYKFTADDIVRPEVTFHPEAGKCAHCGVPVGQNDKVCNQCGAPIGESPNIILV